MTALQRSARTRALAIAAALALAAPSEAGLTQPCVGDCDGSHSVAIDELIVAVSFALGNQPLGACPSFGCEEGGTISIQCLLRAVRNALDGCPCPLAAGSYTFTQQPGGGSLEVQPL